MTGRISAKIGTLSIDPSLSILDARLEVDLNERGVKISKLEGKAGAGTLTTTAELTRLPTAVALSANVAYVRMPSSGDGAQQTAEMTLDLKGQAASPAALIASLVGTGQMKVTTGEVTGLSTEAVAAVVETGIQGKGPVWGGPLQEALKTALKQGKLPLDGKTLPLTVSDGLLKLDTLKLDHETGRSQLTAMLELQSMKADAQWTVEPKVQQTSGPPERAYLPAITVVYAGKLGELADVEPQITYQGLERELNLRRTEREVEQLEQIRKADQARAKAEKEKREQERAAAQAAAAAAAAAKQQQAQPQQASPAPAPPSGDGTAASSPAQPSPQQNGAPAAPPTAPEASGGSVAPQEGAAAPPPQADASAQVQDGQAPAPQDALPAGAPAPQEAPKPQRRRKPADENWRPFQQPF